MFHSIVYHQHVEIYVGGGIILEERTRYIHPQRQNNSHIIEYFIRTGFSGQELAEVNRRCK